MIEYGSPADRRGTVAVTALSQYRQMRESFPARNVSAEGVLFTLKKLVRNTVEDGSQMPAFVDEIAAKLLQTYGPIETTSGSGDVSLSTDSELKLTEWVQRFKRAVFSDSLTLQDRYTVLASHACDINSNYDLQRVLIAYRLAIALQDIPAALSNKPFSAEIRNHHQKMITLVQKLIESDTTSVETVEAIIPERSEVQGEADTAVQLDFAKALVDVCDFCTAPVPFTDIKTASCTNGHQFPRCGLSLLAIQAPGITKYCGICSTPFLNEEFVVAQESERRLGCTKQRDGEIEGNIQTEKDATEIRIRSDGTNGMTGGGDVTMESTPREEGQFQKGQFQSNVAEHSLKAGREKPANVTVEEERREPPLTFARVLFLACDACIYCGGKFVG
jgi:hypothetical protein